MTEALEYLSHATLAVSPRYVGYMLSVLQGRVEPGRARADIVLRGHRVSALDVVDKIAVIPVLGPIFHRPDLFSTFGAVSVAGLRAQIGAALDDPDVEAILLVVDSPGGEVAGVADLADDLYAARGKKPMMAVADEGMFSAAYWIGSAVGPVVLPRTGSVGSVGALVVHTDVSSALDRSGYRVSVVKSGARKAMFSPFAPLSEDAREALQAEVNRVAGFFIEATSRQRRLSDEKVRGLEGGTLEGQAAVDGGLADALGTAEDAFLALRMHLLHGGMEQWFGERTRKQQIGGSRERDTTMALEIPPVAGTATASAASTGTSAGTASAPETLNPPVQPATPWSTTTNVISIETARKQAREESAEAERLRASRIIHWCAFAGKADLAEQFIASRMSVDQVQTELVNMTAAAGFEIDTTRGAGFLGKARLDSIEEVYARRKQAINEAWANRRYF